MDAPAERQPRTDEAKLVARLRQSDSDAYDEVLRAYGPRLLPVARRILRNEADAQEAFQDAMLSAFRGIDAFDGRARLSTWLHRIVANAALMKLRGRRRRPECRLEDLLPRYREDGHRADPFPAWTTPGETPLERNEIRAIVLDQIELLPVDSREVLILRDVEGVDTSEAARQLGISSGAVKTRLHRARQALRTLLEKEFLP